MTTANTTKLTQLKRTLVKKNRYFQELTLDEKRVRIAQDVRQQLRAKKMRAASKYLAFGRGEAKVLDTIRCLIKEDPTESIGTVLAAQKQCHVCGIGSLFVAATERDPELMTVRDLENSFAEIYGNRTVNVLPHKLFGMQESLLKYFDAEQLDLIEAYFEKTNVHAEVYNRDCLDRKIDTDHPIWKTKSKNERLDMIMKNIIKNDGKFIP
jgi:hypothetical protein